MASPRPAAGLLRRAWRPLQAAAARGSRPGMQRHQPRRHQSSAASPSSVNPDEISHFDALASTWWDSHGASRLLHQMNPLRHDFIRACHSSQPDGDPTLAPPIEQGRGQGQSGQAGRRLLRYLDVGCGGGIFAESAARLPSTASVMAIDASAEVLAVARAHARRDPALAGSDRDYKENKKLTYVHTSIEGLPVPATDGDKFDVVSLFEVLEHVDAPAAFLERCGAFVKPGGWLVLSTIARTWTSWLLTNVVAEDVLRIVPRGTHDWAKYINEDELRGYFAGRGWNSPRCVGVVYVPGLGWKEVAGSEKVGNYFFGVRRDH